MICERFHVSTVDSVKTEEEAKKNRTTYSQVEGVGGMMAGSSASDRKIAGSSPGSASLILPHCWRFKGISRSHVQACHD